MTVQVASLPSRAMRKSFDRSRLLVGVSLLALLGSVGKVDARNLGGRSGGVSSPAAMAAANAAAGAQQSSAAGQQAIRSMARAAQSLQGMRGLQGAARAAALAAPSGAVPDGLTAGGLVVAPGAGATPGVWVGAAAPSQTQANGRTQVEIKQTEQKAILNWSSFNVGRETDLHFDQTAGGADASNWIALNRVTDPSLAPSRILGTIKAEGQVYVINKNGIVFGGASQINVNSFVASSLSLSDEQFRAGINKQILIFDDTSGASIARPQFGYLGQQDPNKYIGLDAPGQVAGAEIGEAPGDVRIEAGAQLTMASGGKAMVFAPHVVNSGRISATDGQVILAAGEQVYLGDRSIRHSRSGCRRVGADALGVQLFPDDDGEQSDHRGHARRLSGRSEYHRIPRNGGARSLGRLQRRQQRHGESRPRQHHADIAYHHPERRARGIDRAEQPRRLDPAARVGKWNDFLWRRRAAGFAALLVGRYR